MPGLNRRKFLVTGAGVGALGLMSATMAVGWDDLLHAAHERPLSDAHVCDGILVIVTLYGGNDGINTVIPYADNAYYDARPELAYAPNDVLHLDDHLGLNPAMKGLAQLWNQRQLAIVRGVGYPKPDHSHFRSMDIWQSASPAEPVSTGWIGRWLDATGDDPLRAVHIGSVLPLLAVGENQTAAALSTATLTDSNSRRSDILGGAMQALGTDDPTDTPAMAAVRRSYRAARTTGAAFAPIKAAKAAGNALTGRLSMVAAAIRARVPTRVYLVHLGGFDTHADERDTQQELLQKFDEAATAFLREMAADRCGRNVVMLAYSEFGRRVAANASQGTDHGTAGPVFVAGVPVKGGFYGEEPSLTDLDRGDLKPTTDFRDIYHDLLAQTLGVDPAMSVGSGRKSLGLL